MMIMMSIMILLVVVVISSQYEVESFFRSRQSLSRSKNPHITDPEVVLLYSQEIMLHLILSQMNTEHM